MTAGAHVLIFPFLRRAGLHSDIDVARIGAGRNRRFVSIEGPMGGTRVTAKVAFQPLRRLEFPRFILLLQVQWLLRQSIFPSGIRETCDLICSVFFFSNYIVWMKKNNIFLFQCICETNVDYLKLN